jgi:hypothetical protein
MARCEVCGNEYDKSFEVVMAGERHTFPHHRARSRGERRVLLLCALRARIGHCCGAGPRLTIKNGGRD